MPIRFRPEVDELSVDELRWHHAWPRVFNLIRKRKIDSISTYARGSGLGEDAAETDLQDLRNFVESAQVDV
jgi:hypothetical protein